MDSVENMHYAILFLCEFLKVSLIFFVQVASGTGYTGSYQFNSEILTRARICKRLRSPGNDSQPGGIDSFESIPGLLKRKFGLWEVS